MKGPKISPEFINRLKEAVSMIGLVGEHVVLKKTGASYVGLCPFHSERSPSFTVSEEKKVYHCHGCGEGGDMVDFIREIQGLSFIEAIRELSDRAGIPIPEEMKTALKSHSGMTGAQEDEQKKKLFKINLWASRFYQKNLKNSPHAQTYLRDRKMSETTLEEFYVGYAPEGWDHLAKTLESVQAPLDLAKSLGIIQPSKMGGSIDFFRDRIVFPMVNMQRKIVGFGGRTLGKTDGPKYLNSSESILYKKSKSVFGLFQAQKHIREKNELILVEGYFDVLAMHQAGFKNTVAVCGTRMTGEHLRVFQRFADKIIIFYDGDRAGQESMESAMETALSEGVIVHGAFLPQGLDPDEFLLQPQPQEELRAQLSKILGEARPLLDERIDHAIEGALQSSDLKTQAIKKIAHWLSIYRDPVGRSVRSDFVAQRLGLDRNWLKSLFGVTSYESKVAPVSQPSPVKTKKVDVLLPAERVVLGSLVFWDQFKEFWIKYLSELPPQQGPKGLFGYEPATKLTEYVFFTRGTEGTLPQVTEGEISSRVEGYFFENPESPLKPLIAKAQIEGFGRFKLEEVEFAFASLLKGAWARFSQQISQDLVSAESRKDAVLQDKLLKEYLDVQRKIKELSRLYDKNDRTYFDAEV